MNCYVVTREGEALRFTQHDQAKKSAGKNDAIYIESAEALQEQSSDELIALYNTFADKPVSKFSDKKTAITRIMKELDRKARRPDFEKNGKPSGRPSRFTGKRIYKNVAVNPRKYKTHGWEAWEQITDGMSYEDYMDACDIAAVGGRGLKHLLWCIERKVVTIDG